MDTITIPAGSEVLSETVTLYVPADCHEDIRQLAPYTVYGEHYDRAVLTTLRDASEMYRRGYAELAADKLAWCLERKGLQAGYTVLPGTDLDEALSLELVRRSSECECSPSSHWREDSQGNERRIVCGCNCDACGEY